MFQNFGGVVSGSADEPTWRRAERCEGGQCLEIGILGGFVIIRNSADPGRACLALRREEWRAFVSGVKSGEFDDI